MQYNGHVTVPHDSYENFKNYVLDNGFNWDGYYGDQCWDGCQLAYGQYGLTLQTGPNSAAYECWTVSRLANSVEPFSAVNKADIKKGDIVVFSNTQYPPYGHIGFADEDLSGDTIRILGQNQGGIPYSGGGAYFNLTTLPTANILGGFRNSNWYNPPTPPRPAGSRRRFPWPIFWRVWRGNR